MRTRIVQVSSHRVFEDYMSVYTYICLKCVAHSSFSINMCSCSSCWCLPYPPRLKTGQDRVQFIFEAGEHLGYKRPRGSPEECPLGGLSSTNKTSCHRPPLPCQCPGNICSLQPPPEEIKNWIGFFGVIKSNTTGRDLLFTGSYTSGIYLEPLLPLVSSPSP